MAWDFEGKSCADSPSVVAVELRVDALAVTRHACGQDGEDGTALGRFEAGEHAFAARALDVGGDVLFTAEGTFTVAGDVGLYVHLTVPPHLTLQRTWFVGASAANEFYRGVPSALGIEISNPTRSVASDVTGRLLADYRGVTIANGGVLVLGALAPGATRCVRTGGSLDRGGDCAQVDLPRVTADSTVPDNANVEFTLTLTSPLGLSWTFRFNGHMRGDPPH